MKEIEDLDAKDFQQLKCPAIRLLLVTSTTRGAVLFANSPGTTRVFPPKLSDVNKRSANSLSKAQAAGITQLAREVFLSASTQPDPEASSSSHHRDLDHVIVHATSRKPGLLVSNKMPRPDR
ncbi:hypothetical protein TNIN_258571 [Trichonephila inaurata madagascariensis]|uniref:Uncharacterized protein n=1 Tax=Trichonephila inaurata madagascariensis TaxID=2747483 RepID=A0A8X6YAT8_9ARAC|nr:hypothetical protein TNIN_322591 [Trichonephila inaurata madagascariensis]GFY73961.1 hypothetical protein TNIN_258571 [Trichonephila inaurata madagascariensis]